MQTANRLGPTKVGVATGTTTMLLAGPKMQVHPRCDDDPDRRMLQKLHLWPPGKYRAKLPTVAEMADGSGNAAPNAGVVATSHASRDGFLNPYASIETLKGPQSGGFFARLKNKLGLGIVLAPYGDRSPNPSVEMTAAGRRLTPTCTGGRGHRGPSYRDDYQGNSTVAYRPMGDDYVNSGELGRMNLAGPIGTVFPETSGGRVYPQPSPRIVASQGPSSMPTDTQLSTEYGYTPVIQQWVPFKQGNYPAPWTPPNGLPAPAALAGPTMSFGRAGFREAAEGGTPLPPEARAIDPAAATIEVLRQHQDRMFSLGIISAAAVAGTALINVFRYSNERREGSRKSNRKVPAEPNVVISGPRRRR